MSTNLSGKARSLRRFRAPILLGLALLLASALGAGMLVARDDERGRDGGGTTAAVITPARSIACLGYVDVTSGVLSLQTAIAGRVVEVSVHANETVEQGKVLLRLDEEPARLELAQAEANVQAAETQLAEAQKAPEQHQYLVEQQQAALAAAQHQLESAQQAFARRQQLIKEGNIPPAEVTAAEENVRRLESARNAEQAKLKTVQLQDPALDIRKAEANLRARQALRDKAQYGLQQCRLTAPANGTILRVLAQVGDIAGPQSPQPALLFLPAEPRIVRAEVEQEFAPYVAVGQRADITDDAFAGGVVWHGHVRLLSDWFAPRRVRLPDIVQPTDVRTLECIVELDPSQPPPRIGQRMRVKLYREH